MNNLNEIADLLDQKSTSLPINKKDLETVIDILYHNILFPICKAGCQPTAACLKEVHDILFTNISNLTDIDRAESIVDSFIRALPQLKEQLYNEAFTYLKNDPAAQNVEEVIVAYPGFFALSVHRISHLLYKLQTPIIPRLFSEHAHSKVGIDIHPGATIGKHFYIDHGTGIVIGETCIIGNNVKIYQGVTLGALFVDKKLKDTKRHPSIEDNVVIYAGATILGGTTTIGHDSTIGGNVWLTQSVVPYSIVFNHSQFRIKNNHDFPDSFNYTI